ncbi:hypothetical protein GCM10027519_34520 [Kineococcus endophyticus]
MATDRPVASAAARTPSKFARWSSCEPWLKFIRATSIPASTSDRNPSGPATAGPRVQTIFALRMPRPYCAAGGDRRVGRAGLRTDTGSSPATPPRTGDADVRGPAARTTMTT